MKKIILLILVLAFTSCAKKDVKTDINVDFSQFINGGFPVGATVILYGKSNSGRSFTRILNSTNFSSDIPVDIWDFYIISWSIPSVTSPDDQTPFQGSSTCAVAKSVDLTGTEVTLDLQMTNSDCSRIVQSYSSVIDNSFSSIPVEVLKVKESGVTCTSGNLVTLGSDPSDLEYCIQDKYVKFYVDNSNNGNSLPGRVTSKCLGDQGLIKKINIPSPDVFNKSGFQIYSASGCIGNPMDNITYGSEDIKYVANASNTLTLYIILDSNQ